MFRMAKQTKIDMVNTLKGFLTNATKEAKDVIDYAVAEYNKNARNVTLEDLKDTIETVRVMVQPSLLPVENSLKKPNKDKKIAANEDEVNAKLAELEESIDEEDKALGKNTDSNKKENSTKKTLNKPKKQEDKKPEETKKEHENKKEDNTKKTVVKTAPKVVSFPDKYESEAGKLKVRRDIESITKLTELMEEGTDLVVLVYWTKRDLRQYQYDPMKVNHKPIDQFKDDLDVQQIVYSSDNGIVFTTISLDTEVPFIYTPTAFKTDEYGLRYMNGVEYQIYEVVE